MHNTTVFGLSYTSDSDLVRNDKSKPRPWRMYSAGWFGCTAGYGEGLVNKVALTRYS